ncbi:MAG: hypothetical protein QOE45_39 [Frankiaceae bacterium]|jgi:hypothetical protein|nr:hypothetical protein [Frankiaceae bacterium]
MTPEEFTAVAESRLAGAKYTVTRLALSGAPAVVGQRKPFRAQWMFTQLKTSVVVSAVDHATGTGWMRFLQHAFLAAKDIKGGLPNGLQSGVGAVPVLAATSVDAEAALSATERPQYEWFTGVSLPALVDLSTGQVHQFDQRVLVGAIYLPFLRKQRSLVTSIAQPV